MTDQIYSVITGDQKYFWPECLKDNFVSLSFDKAYFDAWSAQDKAAHLALFHAKNKTAKNRKTDQALQSDSTTWWNYATNLTESEGDVFFTRVGDDIFWSVTTPGNVFYRPHKDPVDGREVVAICKPVAKWSRFDKTERPLQWSTLHKRPRVFLGAQSAMFPVKNQDMYSFLLAMIEGADLKPWYEMPSWKAKQGEDNHKYLAFSTTMKEQSVHDMMQNLMKTVTYANGQLVVSERMVKQKDLVGCTPEEMHEHLKQLLDEQVGRCALTNIVMHHSMQPGMILDLKTSADRKDSNGHYQIGNMQIVCRFVNYWKSSMPEAKFRNLLKLVIEANHGDTEISPGLV